MRLFSLLLCSVTLTGLIASAAPADDIVSVQVKLPTPKNTKDKRAGDSRDTAPMSVWIPADVKFIRGAVVNPFYEKAAGQEHWHAAARQWNFAVVGANLFGVKGDEAGEVIAQGLLQVAEKVGHPELATAPLCFVGMSAGGGLSVRCTEQLVERTIAAAPVCLEVGPRDEASRQVPIVTVFGERDGRQMEKLLARLPEERAAGAQWAIAVQWNKKHEFARANNIAMPWFDHAITMRLGEPSAAGKAPQLAQIPQGVSWVGVPGTWDQPLATIAPATDDLKVERSQTVWLPNAYVAHVWQAFVTPPRGPLNISSPPGVGDGDSFTTYQAGEPLTVTLKVAKDAQFERIDLFDGDRKLAEFSGTPPTAKIEQLAAGIRTLIAQGVRGGKLAAVSPPNVIVVE